MSPQTFNGSTFIGIQETSQNLPLGESSFSTVSNDNVPRHSFSSISIPRNVFSKSNISHSSSRQKLIFIYYKETKFFRVSRFDTKTASRRLNSFVIAGSIKGLQVENLTYPVKIAFQSITPGDTDTALCSYWDFMAGNWSQEGCAFERVLSNDRILCSCNHLTNFAMLMVSFLLQYGQRSIIHERGLLIPPGYLNQGKREHSAGSESHRRCMTSTIEQRRPLVMRMRVVRIII